LNEGVIKTKKLNEKGNVAIILCVAVVALFGFTAYVVDIGLLYVQKTRISNAIDSAVMAAMLELPSNPVSAKVVALDYLEKNGMDSKEALVTISADNKSIQIDGVRTVNHYFAPVIGIKSGKVGVSAKAEIGPVKSATGIRPFAVEPYNFNYGEMVTLKEGAGSAYHGNFGAVSLGGRGASTYTRNGCYGYSGTVSVGDYIDTEPGNMSGPTNSIKNFMKSDTSTFSNYTRDSIRLWTIPIVKTLDVNGRKPLLVIGFAKFFIEGDQDKSSNINGRFVQYVTSSDIDMTAIDTGLYGVKLVK